MCFEFDFHDYEYDPLGKMEVYRRGL